MHNNQKYLYHTREITVAVNDIDFIHCLKPSAIMSHLQDIATEHADMLNIGYDNLIKNNLGWVMVRMSILVLKQPKIGDTLIIKTFPEKPKNSDVNRGYYVYDKTGEIIITASSKWCVLNMNTFKVQRLTPIFENFNDNNYIPNEPFENTNPKIGKFSESTIAEPIVQIVQVTDLDRNGHMNNARYGDVILNALGAETLKKYTISRIDINFMTQLFIGDKYEIFKEQNGSVVLIEARTVVTNAVIFRARTEMRER